MVECRYYGACRYASGNCSNGGNDAPDCEDFRQMPDTNALLALADEMEGLKPIIVLDKPARCEYARLIRKALGVASTSKNPTGLWRKLTSRGDGECNRRNPDR